jgi:hypothetical protein
MRSWVVPGMRHYAYLVTVFMHRCDMYIAELDSNHQVRLVAATCWIDALCTILNFMTDWEGQVASIYSNPNPTFSATAAGEGSSRYFARRANAMEVYIDA